MNNSKTLDEQPVETPECIHCKHFFDCKLKSEERKRCIRFEERHKND